MTLPLMTLITETITLLETYISWHHIKSGYIFIGYMLLIYIPVSGIHLILNIFLRRIVLILVLIWKYRQ